MTDYKNLLEKINKENLESDKKGIKKILINFFKEQDVFVPELDNLVELIYNYFRN
jgi:hypothetical protein